VEDYFRGRAGCDTFEFSEQRTLKTGIIGARGVGKSTVFHALTGLAPLAHHDAKNRARPGQIKVADPRLDLLEKLCKSKKKVQAELTILDFAPNPKEQKAGAALDLSLMPLVRDLDALLIVIPQFEGNRVELAPAVEAIENELVFADFEQADRRLKRLEKEKDVSEFERASLQKVTGWLESGAPLRKLGMTSQELQLFSSFGFLSRKPALVVINCETENATAAMPESESARLHARSLEAFRLAAAFEAELWELEPAAQGELLREAGLEAPARDRLVAAIYRHLGLITFYTAGEPEAHAWPIRCGSTALEAAAEIHSDIARGFIRAEVIGYEDFAALGSEAKAKEAGKLRLEGRDYIMRDGDVIHVRFKV
jgi:ribosome-binding ATPase